jgi:hypothetical protein
MATEWAERHCRALGNPKGIEAAIVGLLDAWVLYANCYRDRYESDIQNDYVIGEAWSTVADGILGLLDGELGRLDAGTIDSVIRDLRLWRPETKEKE